ncbi:hypothetical protein EUX98_g2744 [Antrodiella citrinella]|uniref:Coiled-coil domain-containing protein 174 n=1 Tax=Antrodiella citrinella TaxID=2447956 RepID=A0A4S4N6J5_9APHY|nr:hypothetical protein EUX98_g2744 [Antrodiella citrinella]
MASASSSKSRSTSKAKAVSTSSFFDLRAEISKHEEEFAKSKAAGKGRAVIGGVQRPGKKPTIWAKPNKGVQGRASRDIELEAISKPTLDTARAILERKVAVYDKLAKGKSGGLSDKQFESLLVDFDSKPAGEWESDSDDVDESLTVPKASANDDDPEIEYEDEFGRQRTARRSDIPRHLLPPDSDNEPPEEDIDLYVVYNPVDHFPIYEPSAERVSAIRAEYSEENNPLNVHYDASQEVRAKGAGFYQFSGDQETRRKQMEELKKAREETEKTRQGMDAVDLAPGEVEGMGVEVVATGSKRSRAMEKRKRELEDRRKLLDAKRRKKDPTLEELKPPSLPALSPSTTPRTMPTPDPLASLEARAISGKVLTKSEPTPADDFLAALERDILKGPR